MSFFPRHWIRGCGVGLLISLLWLNPVQARILGDSRDGEVLVRLNPVSGATIADINTTFGTTTLEAVPGVPNLYRLRVPDGQDATTLAATMTADIRLLYAHVNHISRPPEADPRGSRAWGGPDPTPYHNQYAGAMLGLAEAHAITKGAGVVVAILDTGVQLDHPALSAAWTTARYDFVNNDPTPEDTANGIDDDGDTLIDETVGHGTHIAGIVLYVAPEAKIMPVRVLDSDGSGDDVMIAKGIDYAVNNGANVINLSLGTSDKSDVLDDAIHRATANGVFVVSAAGNENTQTIQFPAAANCSVGITSVGPSDVKSSFSNYGSWVDLSSPGESIYSALIPSGYGWWSGTSMATPFVAGQAALLKAIRPSLTAYDIAALMRDTAKDIRDQNDGTDLGRGRIQIGASVTRLNQGGILPDSGGLISSSCLVGEPAGTATPTPRVPTATAIASITATVTVPVTVIATPKPSATPNLSIRVRLPLVWR